MANDYFTPTSLTANTKARSTEVNTNLTALEAGFDKLPSPTAVKNRIADYVNATAASANTYTATLSPVPSAYVTGMQIRFTVSATNTGAATINLNSLGAKQLLTFDGEALSASYLSTTKARTFTYNGTAFLAVPTEYSSVIEDGSVTVASFASSVYASQVEAEAGTESTKIMTAQRTAQAIAALAPVEFADNAFRVQDNSDATKELAFEVSGITTGTTRTWTVPDTNITFGAFSATLLNTADEAGFKSAVNLEIGTDVAPATSGTAILKGNGSGGFSAAVADTDYVATETDPVVGAITGLVKANGAGTISAAVADTDYVAPDGSLVSFGDLDLVAGDIIYASGTDTAARLAKGTDGQILTLASGVPSWADNDAGGLVQLATASPTSGTQVDFTDISSDYKRLFIEFSGINISSVANIRVYISRDNLSNLSNALTLQSSASDSSVYDGLVVIENYTNSFGLIRGYMAANNGSLSLAGTSAINGYFEEAASAINSIRVELSAGAFEASSTITIFGE